MAITGIDTIEGKQIIAAGAVSAKSAEMAYNDENGNPITGYQLAGDYYSASNPSGFITGVDLTPYQTTAEMTAYQPAGDYLTTSDSAEFYTTANESGFITNDAITGKQDITGMTAYQPVGNYYSASNPSGFITGVDLSDYATTAELADKQDITGMTAYQPVGNYQTAGDYLTTADSANFYTTANESGFITGVDLTPYQTTAGMTAYQPTGDYLTTADSGNFYPMTGNPSGFINELPEEEEVEFEEIDLADYQPVSSMTAYANSANVTGTAQYGLTTAGWSEITAGGGTVPTGIMVESGIEYDANNKISGYSGSAFAGGAELEFEYDAADNISAINNSAISTTPSQALYAQNPLYFSATGTSSYMGINSADLARIFGIDETELWSGSKGVVGDTMDLSEPVSAFNKIKFEIDELNSEISTHFYVDNTNGTKILYPCFQRTNSNYAQFCGMWSLNRSNDDKRLTVSVSVLRTNGTTSADNPWKLIKVIGIGRKEV